MLKLQLARLRGWCLLASDAVGPGLQSGSSGSQQRGGSSAKSEQWPVEAEGGLAGRRAVLGAADTSGVRPPAHPTRTQRKGPGRSRSGSGMWRAAGAHHPPLGSPTRAAFCGGKGPRRCPQGTCNESLTLMEGKGSKTLLLGRRSVTRPVNGRGGVPASTCSN